MEDIRVKHREAARRAQARRRRGDRRLRTGYSSLAYLARLPVETLKIDRAFIITMLDDPNTATLVQTMITLAHSFRLKVVAEGVETEEQAKMLRLLRCDRCKATCSASRCRAMQNNGDVTEVNTIF